MTLATPFAAPAPAAIVAAAAVELPPLRRGPLSARDGRRRCLDDLGAVTAATRVVETVIYLRLLLGARIELAAVGRASVRYTVTASAGFAAPLGLAGGLGARQFAPVAAALPGGAGGGAVSTVE